MHKFILASAAAASLLAGGGAQAQAPGYGGPPIGQNGLPGGSWTTVCRNGSMGGGVLSAECKDAVGAYHATSLPLQNCRGDIGDQNGALACASGQKGSVGPVVTDNRDRRDDRQDRRDDRAAAAVAGAVVGALVGPPPPPPPGLAPPPQGRDWRYEQGGWGYGHRPGEWVPIRDRANWLNDRIDRAQRDGRIGRRDARDLHRQLDDVVNLEGRYTRDGRLGAGERDDLQRRFDDLERRIDYQTRR
jgi:hypothetical protein